MTDPTPAPKKRKSSVKTTQRSIRWCKAKGYDCALVERRLPRGFTTVDAFGFIDIICMDPFDGVLAIQSCGGGDVQAHKDKIAEEKRALRWLGRHNRLVIHSWRKLRRGKVAWRWAVRIIEARLEAGVIAWREVEETER